MVACDEQVHNPAMILEETTGGHMVTVTVFIGVHPIAITGIGLPFVTFYFCILHKQTNTLIRNE